MVISTKKQRTTTTTTSAAATDNSGMGFLLVFFPNDDDQTNMTTPPRTPPPPSPNKQLLPCFPSSYSPPPSSSASTRSSGISSTLSSPSSSFRRRTSSSDRLLTKAQSTISICALLVFITLLVFTLSTFEPTSSATPATTVPRRFLSQAAAAETRRNPVLRFTSLWQRSNFTRRGVNKRQFALQGMGTLFRRGTRAMNDLVIAHVTESTTDDELRLFLRSLHRSGLTARADLALILCSKSQTFESVIHEENDSFSRLLLHSGELNGTGVKSPAPSWGFNASQFVRPVKSKEKEVSEPLWGKRKQSNSSEEGGDVGSTRLSYGSVVGFEASELDPENSLAGFLDHVPMSLRRWGCYQMLLGRVRRSFKHVMLVDVRSLVVLCDPMGRVRSRSPESVYLIINKPEPGRHGKKNSDKTAQGQTSVNAGMVMGGARGVRRLAAAMLTEIVRAAMQQQHKRKGSSVTESAVLSQLAGNEHLLRNVEIVRAAAESPTPELGGPRSDFVLIQRGNSVGDLIMKQMCSGEMDSSVYKDC